MDDMKYRVVGIRADGSRLALVGDATQVIAEKIKRDVPFGIFADVVIEQDTTKPAAGGRRSIELFPDQPPHPAQ